MTLPPEPPPAHDPTVQDLVTLLNSVHETNAQRVTGIHLGWALVLVGVLALVGFAGFRAYAWHVQSEAAIEQTLVKSQADRDSAAARSQAWERRAMALADSVRIDTEHVTREIEHAVPIMVPIPNAKGDTDFVPMIRAISFDSLGASCTRLAHDCTATVAAKDSAMAELRHALAAADSMTAARTKQANAAERANFLSKLLWGSAGLAAGRLSCSAR